MSVSKFCSFLFVTVNKFCVNYFHTVFQIEFKYAEIVTDQQLVGARFIHEGGRGFCTTGYDSSDITFFVQ